MNLPRHKGHHASKTIVLMFGFAVLTGASFVAVRGQVRNATPTILGKVSGSCTFDKTHTVPFVDGVAIPGHLYVSDRPATLVFLSNFPLGAYHPELRVEARDAIEALPVPRGAQKLITLYIDQQGRADGVEYLGGLRTGWDFIGSAKNGRVTGKVSGSGGVANDRCSVTIDVPLMADYGAPKSLAAGGAEPGQAMRALWAALKEEDRAATLAALAESWVATVKQGGAMPEFVAVFGSGGGDRVIGGQLFGATRAILDLDLGGPKARALVLKEGERWRVQDVSFD